MLPLRPALLSLFAGLLLAAPALAGETPLPPAVARALARAGVPTESVSLLVTDFVRTSKRAGGQLAEGPAERSLPYRAYLLWLTFPPMALLFLDRPFALVVAYGALGAPIQGLASVTGYPPEILGGWMLAVALAGVGVHAAWAAPGFAGGSAGSPRDGLVVATLNLRFGEAETGAVVDWLGEQDPHVVVLTETTPTALAALESDAAVGPVGTGKTTLAMLISKAAIQAERTVAIYSLPRLLNLIRDTIGSAAAPAARCRTSLRQGSLIAPSLNYGRRSACRHQSGLMLAARITLPHFSV